MDESGFLNASRVAIVGLGLMGGSLALALHGRCRELLGVDPDPTARSLAIEKKVVDQVAADPGEILSQADLVILAAPVGAILGLIERLPDLHPGAPVVMDLGSTKFEICQALDRLPGRFDPLGGHPMCGKESGGLANAESGLFREAVFALTALERTSSRARAMAESLARTIGSRPLWLDAETHDRWAAATSHFPYLLSCALAGNVPFEAAPLAGPGFRSTTRLADSAPGMMLDVLLTNREAVLSELDRFRRALDGLAGLLAGRDTAGLQAELERSRSNRRAILEGAAG